MGTIVAKPSATRPLLAVALATGLGIVSFAGPAAAQATCDWYGKIAIKQQQENEQRKCGFKGDAWSSDLKAHMAWCASVSPEVWKKAAVSRDQQLASCTSGGAVMKAAPMPPMKK